MHPLLRILPLVLLLGAAGRLPAPDDPTCDYCLSRAAAAAALHGGSGLRGANDGRIHDNTLLTGLGGVATAASGRVVARQGPAGMLYHASAFSVYAESTAINENGSEPDSLTRTQLSGEALFDDGTVAFLPGAAVFWQAPVPGSALESISAAGVAQAATVPDTVQVPFTGYYEGLKASGTLWVVNLLPDNHGIWAGDGFDDLWQIENGIPGPLDRNAEVNGIPTWMHYAFGRNPLASSGGDFVKLVEAEATGVVLTYTRNPLAQDVTFTPEVSNDSLSGFAPTFNYIEISTPEARDRETVEIHFPPPPSGTKSQFFRLRVDKAP